MNKRIVIAVGGAVVVVAAVLVWRGWRSHGDDSLVMHGNVDIRQVSLAFDNAERVREMRVEEGDKVVPGQVLAREDTEALSLQAAQLRAQVVAQQQAVLRLERGNRPEEIAQADARLASAEASEALAKQQLARLRGVASDTGGRGVSQDQLDSARSHLAVATAQRDEAAQARKLVRIGPRQEDIAQARAQLDAGKAQLALVDYRIDQGTLKAPAAGVIRARLLEPGDMASPQRPVYTLALTDPKWVRVYATEVQLGRLHPGAKADVYIDSAPEHPVAGHVGYIASVAEFTPKTVQTEELRTSLVYEVRVLVDDPGDRLRLGMPATVHIEPGNAKAASAAGMQSAGIRQ